ncbi:MAG: dodecin domain-containing protein [Acidimicrobiia bacterium]|nr:dodecin domain-containing protein [Acidimicrobiia bacterium]
MKLIPWLTAPRLLPSGWWSLWRGYCCQPLDTQPQGGTTVSDFIDRGAVKVIEIIGVSDKGFEDAISQAVEKASESISGITGVEVTNMNARVVDGKVMQYRAACKLAFAVK